MAYPRRLALSISCAASLLALGAVSPAFAQSFPSYGSAVSGNIDNTGSLTACECFTVIGAGAPSSSDSLVSTVTGALSSSVTSADLGAGVLSASAVSGQEGLLTHSAASSLVWDTLTFSGVTPGETAIIDMNGTTAFNGSAVVTAGSALISAAGLLGVSPTNFLGGALNGATFAPGQTTYDYQNTVGLANGQMVLLVAVSATAGNDGAYNAPPDAATITDPYSLILPAGVTYTSAFQQAAPVPEPSAAALMLTGLLAVVATLRRQRQRQTPP